MCVTFLYPSAKYRLYQYEAFLQVSEPWTVIGLDLVGPLKETLRGHKYIMSMTDLYTKWVAAAPLRSKTAWEVCGALIKKLYSFGMVQKIITDQGKEFVNEVRSFLHQ